MSETFKLADFLADGGEMGALIRAYDWQTSSLGPPELWPHSLRVSISLMLNSSHPMFIWWGPDLIQFYNDAYRQTLGSERHPSALGQRGQECWEEIWPIIGPKIAYVMAGKGPIWEEDQLVPLTRNGKLEDVWWTFSFGAINLEDKVGGVLVICNDATKQHLAQLALSQQTKHLEQLFEQAPGFMAVLKGPSHVYELTNVSYRSLVGEREFLGKPLMEVVPEIEGQGFLELLNEVYRSGTAFIGKGMPLNLKSETTGSMVQSYLDFIYQPIFDAFSKVSGIFVEGHDVTEHVQSKRHLQLMNEELKHRVKNILTIVVAIASQTFRRDSADHPAVKAFNNRIIALAANHDLLTSSTWASATIDDVVNRALAPYGKLQSQIKIAGPELMVGSKQTMALGLAVHELATNSVKYGAFSTDFGKVEITWDISNIDGHLMFQFIWREMDGPPVVVPLYQGFGTKLIEVALKADFTGVCNIIYEPSGVICTLSAPVENLNTTITQPFQL